jgi:putative membrane-bound dehydrogenase-like protein
MAGAGRPPAATLGDLCRFDANRLPRAVGGHRLTEADMTRLPPAVLGLATLLAAAAAPAADPPAYRAGVARVDITPDHPVRLNGFGYRRTESEGVYQRIWAKALALDTGDGSPAVLLAVDVLGIPAGLYDELARRLEKAGVKRERLAATATHTHTAPMLKGANPTIFGSPIPPEHQANIDRYTPKFLDALESVSLAALKDLRPAKLSWGVGKATFAMNRRRRDIAPTDHDLPALFVKDEGGKVRAVYVSYACHAVTLSHNKIGGDWPGYAAAAIEDTFPGAVALVAIGCGADQNPSSGVTGDKEDVAAAQGREIAAEVKRLSGQFLAPVTGALTAKVRTLELPLADLPARSEWEAKARRTDAVGYHARVNLARLDRGEALPTKVDYPVQTWAFGDSLAMVHLPGEVVVDYALRLKDELDRRRLWVTAYANNNPCYIPSERVLKEGGYEGGGAMIYYDLPNPFKPGLEEKIVGAVREQIGKEFPPKYDPKKTGGTRPLSPQQSLAAIRTKRGLRVDLVAAEPLVADPVAIAFGPDGKLWVAEMSDYPTGRTGKFDPGGRVVFLEDVDGDGFFDRSTVFLDSLPFPTGVLPWRKGILVCAAPDILYAEDTTGDGRADRVEKLYSGFGTSNYQARVNGLHYGLDGWVYGSCGLAGGTITCHRTGRAVALGNRDFRIRPDTDELEPAAGRTQQGLARDDRGNWFGCDNSNLLWHYPLDDHYLRRNPHVAATNTVVSVPAGPDPHRVHPLKADAQRFELSGPPGLVTAACGLGIYRDDLLGDEYRGNAFTCETVNLVIHRRVLKPNGATFTGVRAADEAASEFLATTDNWCRPVQVATGPDGGLWFADMYRFLIEHPMWIPPADLEQIDVRAGAGYGRVYRLRPEGALLRPWPRLDRLDAAGLVAALDSPNGWQRDMAMMLLVWRNDSAARGPLEKLLRESPRGAARLHALCTLDGLGALTKDHLAAALADADPGVRRHAVRLAEPHLAADAALGEAVLKLADDPDPQVRLQVAYALGAWPDRRAAEALARLARRSARDPYTTSAVMSSLTADNLPAIARVVTDRQAGTDPPSQLVRDLLATAAGVDGGQALPDLLAVMLRPDGGRFRPWQLAAAAGALDSLRRQGKGWARLPADARAALAPAVAFARTAVESDGAPEADILAAIPLLARDPADRSADVRRLAALLDPARPARVQSAAVAALARTADPAVPAALLAAWPHAGPGLRGAIIGTLYGRPAWHPELLTALEAGTIPPGQVEAPIRFRLVYQSDPATRARAEKVFGTTDPDRRKVLAEYESALALPGDRARGKAVFAKTCAPCHALEGVGHAVGPDLTALANKSPRYLLGEILDPNRNLDGRYVEYRADLRDGRTLTGILAAETATGITLRGQEGKDETVLRSDLERLLGTAKSLMPEGLEKDIPKQDMADLLAYLTAAEPPARRFPGNDPAEVAAEGGTLTLPAARAFIHGEQIVFEPQFKNLGYWSGPQDHAVWRVRLDAPAAFDVYLDYSCADDSAGNRFALDGGDPPLRGAVAATGGWDRYALAKLGTVKLPAGPGRLTFRPDGPINGALLDLRTLYLVPVGARPPQEPKAGQPTSPAEAAKMILDDAAPRARREALAKEFAPQAAAVVRAMTADLPDDAKEEYRRIPWVWRVSVAAGRTNDAKVLTDLLDVSLPKEGEPLKDWQAVVIGGGVVHGVSLEDVWPGRRVAELLKARPGLAKRWAQALKQSEAMADDEKVPTGTRYDALRMIALAEWDTARPRLAKYLAKSAHPELQMGAVSGLADVEQPEAAELLLKAMPDLTEGNRKLAVAGLLRTADRANALLDGIEKGAVKPDWLTKEHRDGLLKHPDEAVRARAAKVLAGR